MLNDTDTGYMQRPKTDTWFFKPKSPHRGSTGTAPPVLMMAGQKGTAMESVNEYRALFETPDYGTGALVVELQALSPQNMADLTRKLYGENIKILAIYKLCDDWK